jgi:hypothetical protein
MAVQMSEGATCLALREKDDGTTLFPDEWDKLLASVFRAGVVPVEAWCTCSKPYDGLPWCDERLHPLVDGIRTAADLHAFCEMPLAEKCRAAGCALGRGFQHTIWLMLSEKLARMAAKAELVLPSRVTEYVPAPADADADDLHVYLAYFFEGWLSSETIKSYPNFKLAYELASFRGGHIDSPSRWTRVQAIVNELLGSREPVRLPAQGDPRFAEVSSALETATTFDELQAACGLACGTEEGNVAGRLFSDEIGQFLELKLAAAPADARAVGSTDNLEWKIQGVLSNIAWNCARETDCKRKRSLSASASQEKKARKN